MYKSDIIYHDDRVEEIESLPPTADHRDVDLAIVNADLSGWGRVPSELSFG